MRGDTHSDMEKWKTCWERHLVISKQGDSWLSPNTPSPSQCRRFTCYWASKPPHYNLFYRFIVFPQKQGRTTKEREEETGWREMRKTPQIYMPLRNWGCISLSCAVVYCAWLSNEKNGTEKGWAGCWAIKAAVCAVACQHWRQSARTDLVTQTHPHTSPRHKEILALIHEIVMKYQIRHKKDISHLGT